MYETEYDAQKAEDEYIEEYFTNLSNKVAVKRRKLRHIVDPEIKSSAFHIKIM